MFQLFKKQPTNIDKNIVRETALRLITENGATTTLEVKNRLRSNHYVAFQWEVSSLMEELAHEEGWAYKWTGRFRVYFIPNASDFITATGVPTFSEN